ncbi:sensor histidine kinase [Terrimonas ferruginea]|uniref:sensor histidine kinase n=1 Tax=Terrimonas ferruginea TaxID=249 RepID=UPI0004184901|nr:histidine kinase [Terrimonas ferruginea]
MNEQLPINRFLLVLFGFQRARSIGQLVFILLVHAVAWALFLWLPLLFYPVRFDGEPVWRRELITKILPIAFFYLNYYYFLPRFFERRKITVYLLLVLLSVIIISVADMFIRSKLSGLYPVSGTRMLSIKSKPLQEPAPVFRIRIDRGDSLFTSVTPARPFDEHMVLGIPQSFVFFSVSRTASTCIFLLLLGGMIRLAYSFLRNQNEKKSLENAHLNAEVNFLKSQINPHFLFNTLNSIYSQAHARSEDTESSILKLSELLRYALYDSAEDQVDLDRDIRYINNYIELQRLRLSSKIQLDYSVTGDMTGKKIAPMLLISFIENAFKHGISYTHASAIDIQIHIFEETLTLTVVNPVIEKDSFAPGGLGLRNVKRRLELVYPERYELMTERENDQHIVHLKLKLYHA